MEWQHFCCWMGVGIPVPLWCPLINPLLGGHECHVNAPREVSTEETSLVFWSWLYSRHLLTSLKPVSGAPYYFWVEVQVQASHAASPDTGVLWDQWDHPYHRWGWNSRLPTQPSPGRGEGCSCRGVVLQWGEHRRCTLTLLECMYMKLQFLCNIWLKQSGYCLTFLSHYADPFLAFQLKEILFCFLVCRCYFSY